MLIAACVLFGMAFINAGDRLLAAGDAANYNVPSKSLDRENAQGVDATIAKWLLKEGRLKLANSNLSQATDAAVLAEVFGDTDGSKALKASADEWKNGMIDYLKSDMNNALVAKDMKKITMAADMLNRITGDLDEAK